MDISISNVKIDLSKSRGSYAFDKITNTEYLDFMSMYSSLPIGYNHSVFETQEFISEMQNISKVKLTNCEYFTDEKESFVESFKKFTSIGIFNNYHFTCTGALAVEAGLKAAMEYRQCKNPVIISFNNSFHGIMSYGNLVTSRTKNTKKRFDGFPLNEFWPQVSSIKELKKVINKFKNNVSGILIEPVQSTSGDIHFDKSFFLELRIIADEYDIPLIFDEIQTGFCTTGKIWYFQHTDIIPDIVIFGKKAQVSGIMVKDKFSSIFNHPEKLCTTWDGDLVDMVRSKYIIKAICENNLIDNSINQGLNIKNVLSKIKGISNVRGEGLLIAFDLPIGSKDKFHSLAIKHKLMINFAGENTIRIRPNLNVNDDEVFDFSKKIKLILSELDEYIEELERQKIFLNKFFKF